MIVYETINLINGKKYIGQDSKNNLNYFGSGKLIKFAIKKYGKENFKKITLEECKTKKELNDKERYWIRKVDAPNDPMYYNIVEGGTGGYNELAVIANRKRKGISWDELHGKEEAERLREIQRNRIPVNKGKKLEEIVGKERAIELTKINQEQARRFHTGRKRSKETCRKISEGNKNSEKRKAYTGSDDQIKNSRQGGLAFWEKHDKEYFFKLYSDAQKKRYEKAGPKITEDQVRSCINSTKTQIAAVEYCCENYVKLSVPTFMKYRKLYGFHDAGKKLGKDFSKKCSLNNKKRHINKIPKVTREQTEECIKNTQSQEAAIKYCCEKYTKICKPTFIKYMKLYKL